MSGFAQYRLISESSNSKFFFDRISKKIVKIKNSDNSSKLLNLSSETDSSIWKNLYKYTIADLKKAHEENLRSLILVTSEQCNMRCKYCVYGEKYSDFYRKHNNAKISVNDAINIVSFFLDRSTKTEKPLINFYGGEPLLNFDTIRKTVEFAKGKMDGIKFSISTNGTLLRDEIISFCDRNDCQLVLSLDGYKEINDKNRILGNGKGSFDIIANVLLDIRLKYPKFCKKNIFILVHLEPPIDIEKAEQFLEEYAKFTNISKVSFTLSSDNATQGENDEKNKNLFISELRSRYIEQIKRGEYSKRSIAVHFFNSYIKDILGRYKRKGDYYLEICTPGVSRLYASPMGELYLCEKADYNYSIGNIRDGFNYNKIKFIMDEYSQSLNCRNCWINSFCSHCFLDILGKNSEIDNKKLSNRCNIKRDRYKMAVELYVEIMDTLSKEELQRYVGSL